MVKPSVFIALSEAGAATARALREVLGEGELHGLAGRVDAVETVFDDTAGHLRGLFAAGSPIVGLCAAGILIRSLAPLLSDKQTEPPVVAVAEDGSAVVPLLGGHKGANELARTLGAALGIAPAITTAGDARFGVALDDPPQGWVLSNPEHAKPAMAALIGGAAARLEGEAPWLAESRLPLSDAGRIKLIATERRNTGADDCLVYHPKVLAVGVGCERGCAADELIGLVDKVLADNNLAAAASAIVCSLDLKSDEPAIHALAAHLGAPARFFSKEILKAETARLANPSEPVLREVGVAGVAEGAALAAAGPHGALIVEKTKSKRATCAVALSPKPLDAARIGRARGWLAIVGIGPGCAEWLTPEARDLLGAADDWVGYGAYLDLATGLVPRRFIEGDVAPPPPPPPPPPPTSPHRGEVEGTILHRFSLGEEEKRVRHALALAGEGRDVALISSGDPGIYAMAALVYEMLDPAAAAGLSDATRRAEIIVAPGISAFQAAAARAGAPLGHDFCLISLSDLLTPWEMIERRLRAAAEGDFAVCFYNPRSQRRRDQLDHAMTILKAQRPPQTPVIVASHLGREQERLGVTTLHAFDATEVDMTTLVIVGASSTRTFAGGDGQARVYTPRGYAAKEKAAS